MTGSMPFYLEELVCSLSEHIADDDFIVAVCISLHEDRVGIARMISFLEKSRLTKEQIQYFLKGITEINNNERGLGQMTSESFR